MPAKTAPEGEAVKKKSFIKSKKGIMLIVGVLVIGGGAYKFLAPTKVAPPAGGDIVSLTATTLNLADGHYLKIGVDVQVIKGKATSTTFLPSAAEQDLINTYSDRTVASLSTDAARTALTTALTTAIKKDYPDEVWKVYLTTFVTQ